MAAPVIPEKMLERMPFCIEYANEVAVNSDKTKIAFISVEKRRDQLIDECLTDTPAMFETKKKYFPESGWTFNKLVEKKCVESAAFVAKTVVDTTFVDPLNVDIKVHEGMDDYTIPGEYISELYKDASNVLMRMRQLYSKDATCGKYQSALDVFSRATRNLISERQKFFEENMSFGEEDNGFYQLVVTMFQTPAEKFSRASLINSSEARLGSWHVTGGTGIAAGVFGAIAGFAWWSTLAVSASLLGPGFTLVESLDSIDEVEPLDQDRYRR